MPSLSANFLQTIRLECRAIGKMGTGLARPLVTEQAGHGYVQRLI